MDKFSTEIENVVKNSPQYIDMIDRLNEIYNGLFTVLNIEYSRVHYNENSYKALVECKCTVELDNTYNDCTKHKTTFNFRLSPSLFSTKCLQNYNFYDTLLIEVIRSEMYKQMTYLTTKYQVQYTKDIQSLLAGKSTDNDFYNNIDRMMRDL